MSVEELTDIISDILEIPNLILSKNRTHNIARARVISMSIFYRLKRDMSRTDIGGLFDRDHSTVNHLLSRHKQWMKTNKEYAEDYDICCGVFGLKDAEGVSINTSLHIANLEKKVKSLTMKNEQLKSTLVNISDLINS